MSDYIRKDSNNRATGTRIQVIDQRHPDSEFGAGHEYRWATICCDHSMIVDHPTLGLALSFSAVPDQWCEKCQHDVYHRDEPNRDCEFCQDFGSNTLKDQKEAN